MDNDFRHLEGFDAYELLGVAEDCSDRAINQAFRREAQDWHPDKNQHPGARAEAEQKMRLLNAARDVLLDHRLEYDVYRRGDPGPEEVVDDVHDDLWSDPWHEARTDVFTTAGSGPDAGTGTRPPWNADQIHSEADHRTPPRVPPHHHPPSWDEVPPKWLPPTVEKPHITPAYDRRTSSYQFQRTPQWHQPFPPPRYAVRQPVRKYSRNGWLWMTVMIMVAFSVAMCLMVVVFLAGTRNSEVAIPADLSGSWIGSGVYPGTDQLYTVRINLRAGGENGKVDYPLHSCTGIIAVAKAANGVLTVEQRFPESSKCTERTMQLSRQGDGKLGMFRDSQFITLNREPVDGPFKLPESMVGTWVAGQVKFILDNRTPGFSGAVEWDGMRCVLVATATDDDSATLTVGGTDCARHGTWSLTFRKGELLADFKGADGRNIDGLSAPRRQ